MCTEFIQLGRIFKVAKSPRYSLNFSFLHLSSYVQGGSNMTGTDLYVNKPHCAAAVRP